MDLNKPNFAALDIIMVVGSGRSGTTFLATVLNSSPNVLYRHEPDKILVDNNVPFLPDRTGYELYLEDSKRYLEELVAYRDIRSISRQPIFPKAFRSTAGNKASYLAIRIGKLLSQFGVNLRLPDLIQDGKTPIYVIKSVNSMCRAALFKKAAPNLKIIHIVRDPVSVVASVRAGHKLGLMSMENYIDSLLKMPESRNYPFNRDDLSSAPWVQQAAYRWGIQNDKIYKELNRTPDYRLVFYEEVCINLLESMKEIFNFSRIPIGRQMLNFASCLTEIEEGSSGYFDTHRNPISSLNKWRDELEPEEALEISKVASEFQVGKVVLNKLDSFRS